MRKANNNKRGQWALVTLKNDKGATLPGIFCAYEMRQAKSKWYVVFTKAGKLYETYDSVVISSLIDPPKWAASMWDISDEAERVNHFAQLYDARNKNIVADTYVGKAQDDVKMYQRKINFLNQLKTLKPWQ